MSDPLEKEFEYYLEHQDELVKEYDGKFIVIKDQSVIGAYDDRAKAIQETTKEHARGTFIIQKCSPGKEDYTHIFHSRVASRRR